MAVGAAPAHDQQLAGRGAVLQLEGGQVAGDARHLLGALGDHQGVVGRIGGEHAVVVLLQTADAVLEALLAGQGPAAHQRLGVAFEGVELLAFGQHAVHEGRLDLGVILHGGDAPGFGAVAQEAFGEEQDRGHVLQGDLGGLESCVEAVGRRVGGHDGHRAFAVAAVQGLVEVGLLRLGRQAGGGTAALDVHDDQRQLGHHRETHRLGLQGEARAGRGGHGEVAGIGGADGRADAGDLVLRLERLGAQALVDGQLFEDGRGRRDRIGAAEEREARLLGCGQQAPGRGLVARDIAVGALLQVPGGGHRVGIGDHLDVRGVVESVEEDLLVGLDDLGVLLREFLLQIGVDVLQRAVVDVAGHAQGEHVLALEDGLGIHPAVLEALAGQGGDRRDDQRAVLDPEFGEGIVGGEARLLHAGLVEGILVHEDHRVALAPFGVRLEGGGVHGYEQVAEITGRVDFPAADVDLESGHAGDGPVRGADLGRIVRECGKTVAVDG